MKRQVKYQKSFKRYFKRNHITSIGALVAFSGKVSMDDQDYTEALMNGIAEDKLKRG